MTWPLAEPLTWYNTEPVSIIPVFARFSALWRNWSYSAVAYEGRGFEGRVRTSPIGGEGDGLTPRKHAGPVRFCRISGHHPGWVAVCERPMFLHAVDTENAM